MPPGFKGEDFNGDTVYNIMFGPDICGSDKKIHVILNYNGQNHLIKKQLEAKSDQMTHLYTLLIKPDQTYQVLVDLEQVASGSLTEDWALLPPAKVLDPTAVKPEGWVDDSMMDDPNDTKPSDWVEIATIVDPEAKKPKDWDDEDDGEWEAPMIANPEYKGDWKPKRIKNPDYKGPWVHPEIPNPDYKYDDSIYAYTSAFIGFDLWQVKAGTVFDNIIITDSLQEATEFAKETFVKDQPKEKAAKEVLDKQEEERLEKVREEMARKDQKKMQDAQEVIEEVDIEEDHVEL